MRRRPRVARPRAGVRLGAGKLKYHGRVRRGRLGLLNSEGGIPRRGRVRPVALTRRLFYRLGVLMKKSPDTRVRAARDSPPPARRARIRFIKNSLGGLDSPRNLWADRWIL